MTIDPSLAARRATTTTLLGGVSLASIAFIAATTAATLVAADLTGGPAASGLILAAAILGTSAGTTVLSTALTRFPRSWCLAFSYSVAVLGASVVAVSIWQRQFVLLAAGMFVLGTGHSATPMTRYLMADLYDIARRGRALSLVVWVGTIGAVVGPNLMGPCARLAERLQWPRYSALYLVVAALFAATVLLYTVLLVRSRALKTSTGTVGPAGNDDRVAVRLLSAVREPRLQIAVSTLVTSHVVMVLIMAMTPLHLQAAGHSLSAVGLVMSAHIVGMFGFAPLFGWLADRIGPVPVLVAGQLLLSIAAVGAAVTDSHTSSMVMLGVLGIGWNLGFVAGSTLLTGGFEPRRRVALQGRVDTLIWISAAAASAGSSLLVEALGYAGLCWLALTLVTIPAFVLLRQRAHLGGSGVPVPLPETPPG